MKLSVSAYRAHASAHKKILSSSYQTKLNYGSTAASNSSTPANTLFSVSNCQENLKLLSINYVTLRWRSTLCFLMHTLATLSFIDCQCSNHIRRMLPSRTYTHAHTEYLFPWPSTFRSMFMVFGPSTKVGSSQFNHCFEFLMINLCFLNESMRVVLEICQHNDTLTFLGIRAVTLGSV